MCEACDIMSEDHKEDPEEAIKRLNELLGIIGQ